MTHVFISYSRHNYVHFIERFRTDLQHAGIPMWLDKQQLKPGTLDWEKALRVAIRDAQYVLFCASKFSAESQYCRDELSIARMEKTPIIPIWVEGEDDRFHDCIPLGYSMIHSLDARGDKYATTLQELLEFLHSEMTTVGENNPVAFVGSRHASTPQTNPISPTANTTDANPINLMPPRNPYKGLAAFKETDAGDFFGRESVVAALLDKLRAPETRFLAITGASGSGKSSVVMAGLLPQLRANALPTSDQWRMIDPIFPGTRPLENLALRLKKHLPSSTTTGISDELAHKSTRGLYLLAREIAEAHNVPRLVLFIDQFEEIFTQTSSDDERRQFLDVLVTAANEPDAPLLILLTLRADFLHAALNHADFVNLLNQHHYFVKPMALYELENAIQRPADLQDVKLTFEPNLVAEMVFTLRENAESSLAGALPLLQFALERLYENRQDRTLTRAAYEAMGGVQGAIGTHAEAVYSQLTEDAQNALPLVFAALINVDERGTATRRRAPLDDLRPTDAARLLVDTLIKNRLLVAFTETANENMDIVGSRHASTLPTTAALVEVAHEALLRTWTRLVAWIDTAKDDLQLRDAVTTAAEKWATAGKPEFLLWKHEQLAPVYAMQDRRHFAFDATVQEFIIPEAQRLLEKFIADTTHHRRMSIIDRWGEIGEAAVMQMVEAIIWASNIDQDKELDSLCKVLKSFVLIVIPKIIQLLFPSNTLLDFMRRNAAVALGKLGDTSAVPPLIVALQDENEFVRQKAGEALGQLGDISAVPALIAALQDNDNNVRKSVAKALGNLGDIAAVPALIAALQDNDSDVRGNTALALENLGDVAAVPALIAALQDAEIYVRIIAAGALGKLGDTSAVSPLIVALENKESLVRDSVIMALVKLRDVAAVPALSAKLQDDDIVVRRTAAGALGNLGDISAVPALAVALQDENEVVRRTAAGALGNLGDISAVPALAVALQDENEEVRLSAAIALGKLGDVSAVPMLISALRYTSKDMRLAAAELLGKLENSLAIQALIAALQDEKQYVRLSAAEALSKFETPEANIALKESSKIIDDIKDYLEMPYFRFGESEDDDRIPPYIIILQKIGTPEALAALAAWRAQQGDTGEDAAGE